MTRLPNKLSELLRLSVADARKVAVDPRFKLDMRTWIEITERGGPCHVCMAGAVMVKTMRIRRRRWFFPTDIRLQAINAMRTGYFTGAAIYTNERVTGFPKKERALLKASIIVLAAYNERLRRAPWRAYLKAAAVLEAAGL